MAGRADILAGRAYVELLLKDAQFSKGINAAGERFKSFGKGLGIVGAAIAGAGTAITAPLLEMAREFAEAGSEIYNMSKRTHESVASLQFLKYAAEETGTEIEKIQQAIFKTQKDGKNFDQLAAKIAAIQDPAEQSRAAIEAFGKKAGPFLVPLLKDLPRLREEFERLGLGMSDHDVAAAKELETGFFNLTAVIKSARNAIGAALAPTIKEAIGWITNIAISVRDWTRANGELFAHALRLGAVLAGVGTAIVGLAATIAGIGAVLGVFNGLIGTAVSVIGFLISPVGLVVAGLAGLAYWFATSTDAGRAMVTSLAGWFGELRDIAVEAFGGIADALAAGDLSLAAKIAWQGVKAAFLEATQGIRVAWANVGSGIINVMKTVAVAVEGAWSGIAYSMKAIWAGLVATSKTVGEEIGHYLSRQGVDSVEVLDRQIAALKKAMSESKEYGSQAAAQGTLKDLEARRKTAKILGEKGQRELQEDQDRAHDQALAHIKTEHDAEQAKIAAELKAKLDALQAVNLNGDSTAADIAAATSAAAKARAELDALRKKAAQEHKDHELKKADPFNQANVPTGDMLKQQIFGSFSAAALTAGGGAAEPPDVKAIREGNKQRQILLKEARDQRIELQKLNVSLAAHV